MKPRNYRKIAASMWNYRHFAAFMRSVTIGGDPLSLPRKLRREMYDPWAGSFAFARYLAHQSLRELGAAMFDSLGLRK